MGLAPFPPELAILAAVPAAYAFMSALEGAGPGPRWPDQPGFRLKGFVGFWMIAAVNGAAARLWPGRLGPGLVDGQALGVVAGTAAAYAAFSLANAALHLAYHRSDLLWRWVHRAHHAPVRLGVGGVMIQTPLEAAGDALCFLAVARPLFGLSPLQTALLAATASLYGLFQHWDVPTPRWLGPFIQRPEAHSLHHRGGRHDRNYSDLPVWDMLWGTYESPESFDPGPLGFAPDEAPGREARLR